MRKQTSNTVFRLICLLFSALLAVLTLLCGIDQTTRSDRITAKSAELAALREENGRLRAEAACAVDLEELEDYARQTLGMQRCEPGQIIWLEPEG